MTVGNSYRTTLTLQPSVVGFLQERGFTISVEVRRALLSLAIKHGYNDIHLRIEDLSRALNRLRSVKHERDTERALRRKFAADFRRYLEGDNLCHTFHKSRDWLIGPGCRGYESVVGRPQDLDAPKVNELIALAMEVPPTEIKLKKQDDREELRL